MPYLCEGGEVAGGVVSCEVRAHGESREAIRVAPWVFRERGEVPAGGQFFGGVFSDCGGVQPRHRFAPVGVAGQVVEEKPYARGYSRGLGAGRVVVNCASKSLAVERGRVNKLLVPSGYADKVAADGVSDCAGDAHVVACGF